MEAFDAIVVGGGIAGLTAALHLAERGLRPLVLEADPEQAGGRLKGGTPVEFKHGGQTWRFKGEHGVHGVWSPYRNFQAMLSRHNIRPVLVPAREEAWIHGKGSRVRQAAIGSAPRLSWIPAPFHYLNLFLRPPFLGMLNLRDMVSLPSVLAVILNTLSIDPLVEDKPLPGLCMKEYCHWWSPKLLEMCAGLTRNAIPLSPEQSPAMSFIAFLRFYTIRRRDDWSFSYFPDDAGTAVITPLANTLAAQGGALRLGAQVTNIEHRPAGWRVRWKPGISHGQAEAGSGDEGSAEAPHLILATDAPAAETLLRASPSTAEQARCLKLPEGRSMAIFRLWFDRAPASPHADRGAEAGVFTGDMMPDNFFWLDRIYNDYIRWARATGGSAIESHMYGPPELLAQPDADLMARVIKDVCRAWPELQGHLIHSTMTRNPPTHTLLDLGYPHEHLAVPTPWPGLFCCGDWVRDRNPAMFIERACITGIKAANAVLAERGQPAWSLLSQVGPEPLAAWLEQGLRTIRQYFRRMVMRRHKT